MDAKLKEKWVAALRSGKYKQGVGSLKRKSDTGEEQFCCLGVLCDIFPKGRGNWDDFYNYNFDIPKSINSFNWQGERRTNTSVSGTLDDTILEYVGLTDNQAQKLMTFNDDDKRSFNWIASYVERYL